MQGLGVDTNLCRPHALRQRLTVPFFQGWPAVQRPFNIKAHAEPGRRGSHAALCAIFICEGKIVRSEMCIPVMMTGLFLAT